MHETGFKAALTRVLNAYGRKTNILKRAKASPATTAARA